MVVLFIFTNFKYLSKIDFMKHLRYGISFVLCILVTSKSIAQKANISTTQNSIAAEKARVLLKKQIFQLHKIVLPPKKQDGKNM